MKPQDIRDILEREVLPLVNKPGRYIGGEVGAVAKDPRDVEVRIALAFPEVYEIGMSHLGFKILYALVNEAPGLAAERVFAPWPDMESRMRAARLPLYSLETFTPIGQFDILGFSLQYELTYTNILTMLDLAGIPFPAGDRAHGGVPLVIAGGPCASVPGPLEDFIDIFVVGDGEESIIELMDLVRQWKTGGKGKERRKRDLLVEIARRVKGSYVPQLYRRKYSPGGGLLSCEPREEGVPARVRRRFVPALDSSRQLRKIPVPSIGIVHDRVAFEVRRGCCRGCRFCQAGILYRPVRDEEPGRVSRAAREALAATGYDEVALCALSIGDYPGLRSLVDMMPDHAGSGPVSLSLPSLRPDRLEAALADRMSGGRRTGITLAPEAGTERLRRIINKKIAVDDLIGFIEGLRIRGWRLVKLYFMIGLPGETDEDLGGIARLIRRVARIGGRGKGKWEVNVSVSSFIPKAHTVFQWDPMEEGDSLHRKQAFLRREARMKNVRLRFNDVRTSLLEAVFSRGDRELGGVILRAWEFGCRFDGWSETFAPELWRKAFEEEKIDPVKYARRRFGETEYLPWEIVDTAVSREFLLAERSRAKRGEYTPDCTTAGCQGCGVCGKAENHK